MDIFDKAIIRIGRIISDNQKAFKAIDREEIPPYLDCDNEKELLDSYGGGCITKKQFEDGCKYFAEAQKSIDNKGRDYRELIHILSECVFALRGCQHDFKMEREKEYGKDDK